MYKENEQLKWKEAILESNLNMERAEVLLSNLLALKSPNDDSFNIPMDDVIVTLETAILLLRQC
ncbi:hypothetical protein FJ444_20815 [Aestuariibacter sp. GS-14]|uniref:hypothetical protein n=1 Tax=Aestuariibacter sp. GS-14 TaxID=2590670 RepID=UPI00112A1297|nr:hypothetical protein [Aestuariibacter sp. GS-14]TPV52894.1 hypothetical protein FJ444_20815 [Aestuariibacter sp. GS-14]